MSLQPKPTRTPVLRTVPMNLFPTMGSLQEVVELAESKIPVTSRNEMISLLMTYHNTMLAQLPRNPL